MSRNLALLVAAQLAVLAGPAAAAGLESPLPLPMRDCQLDCYVMSLVIDLLSQGERWVQDPPLTPPGGGDVVGPDGVTD